MILKLESIFFCFFLQADELALLTKAMLDNEREHFCLQSYKGRGSIQECSLLVSFNLDTSEAWNA